ncbi:MAG: hypothetical protein NT094_04435 [Candidatus Staskawiczbacteria bacterium]|nr:hypothetical protein [Candidatus Staskawiczbacteria bacterium]
MGYILLIVGVLLIIGPLWQTYNIFTGKTLSPQVFAKPVTLTENKNISATDIQGQIQNAVAKAIPVDSINNTLNLTAWLLLMYILIYGGGKIADIGVKLVK